jgi:hypothetical protein
VVAVDLDLKVAEDRAPATKRAALARSLARAAELSQGTTFHADVWVFPDERIGQVRLTATISMASGGGVALVTFSYSRLGQPITIVHPRPEQVIDVESLDRDWPTG